MNGTNDLRTGAAGGGEVLVYLFILWFIYANKRTLPFFNMNKLTSCNYLRGTIILPVWNRTISPWAYPYTANYRVYDVCKSDTTWNEIGLVFLLLLLAKSILRQDMSNNNIWIVSLFRSKEIYYDFEVIVCINCVLRTFKTILLITVLFSTSARFTSRMGGECFCAPTNFYSLTRCALAM